MLDVSVQPFTLLPPGDERDPTSTPATVIIMAKMSLSPIRPGKMVSYSLVYGFIPNSRVFTIKTLI